jgi:transposase
VKQAEAAEELAALRTEAEAGELALLSQDEARFPIVPTRTATLGVKGHRQTVGTRDCKDLLYVFAVVNVLTAALHANMLESPKDAKKKTGQGKTKRLQQAFAAHLRHVGRVYPRDSHPEVVLLIDNAPWHAGAAVRQALAENPHLKLKRLPSYSPQLNPIERFWKKLRRRATHNRLFDSLADLKKSIRASLCYFQTMRNKVKALLQPRPKKSK